MSQAAELSLLLASVAREAGEELLRRHDRPRTIAFKGATDLVTDADRASERLVLERLARALPGASVVAEESGQHGAGAGLRVYVDPLDGTTNFAHGVPHWSVTLGAADERGLAAGVVFDPLRNELFRAAREGGAWLDGRRLRVSGAADLESALLATGFPYDVRERAQPVLALLSAFLPRARGVRRFGSAALDLAWVAAGRFDGYWEDRLHPWDTAAGVLLVQEAGGRASDYVGGPDCLARGEVVAAGPDLHAAMAALVRETRGLEPRSLERT